MAASRRRAASLALALAAMIAPAHAAADPCDAPLSTCVPSDNLWPYVGGGRWLSQSPTQTAAELSASFGFQLGYIHRPIAFRVQSPNVDGTDIYAVEHALSATVMTAVGVTERLQVQLEAPFVLYQEGASIADVIGSDVFLPRAAVGDFRFGVTGSILRRPVKQDGPGLSARFEMSAPTGHKEAYVSGPSAAYAPGVSFDYEINRFAFGIDVGARVRHSTQIANVLIASQISAALGAGVDVLDDGWLSINAEAFALFTLLRGTEEQLVEGETRDRALPPHMPAEWLLSVRTAGALGGRLRASLGAGSFIPLTTPLPVTTPLVRAVAAIHYLHD